MERQRSHGFEFGETFRVAEEVTPGKQKPKLFPRKAYTPRWSIRLRLMKYKDAESLIDQLVVLGWPRSSWMFSINTDNGQQWPTRAGCLSKRSSPVRSRAWSQWPDSSSSPVLQSPGFLAFCHLNIKLKPACREFKCYIHLVKTYFVDKFYNECGHFG